MGNASNPAAWSVQLRIAYAERFAQLHGTIRREILVDAFGIGEAQVSSDFQLLQKIHPGCLTYDLREKRYRWTGGDLLKTEIPYPVTSLDLGSAPK